MSFISLGWSKKFPNPLILKVSVDWTQKHAGQILNWGTRFERQCHVVLGDMPLDLKYFDCFHRVTRRFIDSGGAKMIIMVSSFISPCLI